MGPDTAGRKRSAFAILPAAGHSVRMGAPKLLLPLAGKPLVLHAIDAWKKSSAQTIVVVVRAGDQPLVDVVRMAGVAWVEADPPPPDMKASIQAGLTYVERQYAPAADAAVLVAPADMPRLSPATIDRLLAEHRNQPGSILVPTLAGHRGHPVLLPWHIAAEVHALAPEEGLDALLRRRVPVAIPCDDLLASDRQAFADIDTPEDYRRLADEPS